MPQTLLLKCILDHLIVLTPRSLQNPFDDMDGRAQQGCCPLLPPAFKSWVTNPCILGLGAAEMTSKRPKRKCKQGIDPTPPPLVPPPSPPAHPNPSGLDLAALGSAAARGQRRAAALRRHAAPGAPGRRKRRNGAAFEGEESTSAFWLQPPQRRTYVDCGHHTWTFMCELMSKEAPGVMCGRHIYHFAGWRFQRKIKGKLNSRPLWMSKS